MMREDRFLNTNIFDLSTNLMDEIFLYVDIHNNMFLFFVFIYSGCSIERS